MKNIWNAKYATIAAYALIVVFCLLFCVFLFVGENNIGGILLKLLSVLTPIFYGALIAYLLSPIVGFFERRLLKFLHSHKAYTASRMLAVVLTYVLLLGVLGLFLSAVIPQILRGYEDLQQMSSVYLETVRTWLTGLSDGEGFFDGYLDQLTEYAVDFLEELYSKIGSVIPDVTSIAGAALGILEDGLLGVVLSVYFLSSKERLLAQIKKLGRSILRERYYAALARGFNIGERNFGGFFRGQLADALILGVLCFLCSLVIGIPYYPLVSAIVGIAAVVPVFGTLIGTVVGALIILLADPLEVLWFSLLMLALSQINRRLIRPHILRTGVDISSAWMLAAILVMTGLIGVWGLFLGIPIFAVLYALLRARVDARLRQKGLDTESAAYLSSETGRGLYSEAEARRAHRREIEARRTGRTEQTLFTEELPCVTEQDILAYEASKEDASDASQAEEDPAEDTSVL